MAGEDDVLPIPNLKVAQYYFTLSNPKLANLHAETSESLLKAIEADGVCIGRGECYKLIIIV